MIARLRRALHTLRHRLHLHPCTVEHATLPDGHLYICFRCATCGRTTMHEHSLACDCHEAP